MGFRKGRGMGDLILNVRWMIERAREFNEDIYLCFIDYSKAFDCVDHAKFWMTMHDMGVPENIIVLMKNIYDKQEATLRTKYGETGSFPIEIGVRQGCLLSAVLFNIYAEK